MLKRRLNWKMKGRTLMTFFFVVMKISSFWVPGDAKILEDMDSCNVTNEGREFVCRGVGFQTVDEVLRMDELRTSRVNLTKM